MGTTPIAPGQAKGMADADVQAAAFIYAYCFQHSSGSAENDAAQAVQILGYIKQAGRRQAAEEADQDKQKEQQAQAESEGAEGIIQALQARDSAGALKLAQDLKQKADDAKKAAAASGSAAAQAAGSAGKGSGPSSHR